MVGWIIPGIVALLIAVILIRAALFRPKAQRQVQEELVNFDKDGAINALAALIKCKTVSYNDHSQEDDGEFEKAKEEYKEVLAKRKEARAKINQLEA